ncbi:EF-hand calcium-binding domain-containing protein 10 isoform X1 [Lagopus muta]|uniref:EF-hand calcium-binding domain-containing protein 10 isoform X1 n=1 Tax=Lagopus muta TaxID=64668 RepID=UPI00209EABB9|nr:EF-hand calcium-binding domain-containing protein 10 isoform X1 [Lagopus muta]XP_048790050.1 EF-hand calcium-binding domain-containing protein 10 isoform X1 [Lagopus muta]
MAAGEQQSREYLERHGLPALLHRLAALLLYRRPERPRQFLLQALEAVRAARRGEAAMPSVLDEADVEAVFRMLDAAGRGFVTGRQCRAVCRRLAREPLSFSSALTTLGLSTAELRVGDEEEIGLATFKEEMMKTLLEGWAVE